MLQRIQTVYLLVTLILSILLFFVPMGGFQQLTEGIIHDFDYTVVGLTEKYDSVSQIFSYSWALLCLMVLILIVNVIGIFLYKNRVFQMRFNLLNILLNIGIYPLFFLFAWGSSQNVAQTGGNVEINYYFPIVFPIINILLTYLAIRAIGKDEALVRSLDRIR